MKIELILVEEVLKEAMSVENVNLILKRIKRKADLKKDIKNESDEITEESENDDKNNDLEGLDEEMFKTFKEKDVPTDPEYVEKLENHNKVEQELEVGDDFEPIIDVEGVEDKSDDSDNQKNEKKTKGSISVPRSSVTGKEKVKKEFFIVLGCAESELPENLTGWVIQADEGTHQNEIVPSIKKVGDQYNNSKKGQKEPADGIGEILDLAAAKYFKEEGLLIKTKNSVWAVGGWI